jgi:hypothetical protein
MKRIKLILYISFLLIYTNYSYAQENYQLDAICQIDGTLPISQVIENIEKKCGITINYSPGQLKSKKLTGNTAKNISSRQWLNMICESENLKMIVNGSQVYLVKPAKSNPADNVLISISGFVKDAENGEVLPGSSISGNNTSFGQFADNSGYFNLKIPNEIQYITFSFVGYHPLTIERKDFNNGISGNIYLRKSSNLKEIIILDHLKSNILNLRDFNKQKSEIEINGLFNKFGAKDALNELILQAGINKLNDFQNGISVNGSQPGDVSYYLDGIRIFEPNHMFGAVSVFNTNAINSSSIYTYNIPDIYSGAIGAVLDFHTFDGNNKKFKLTTEISNSIFNLQFSIPIKKSKTSFTGNFRQSLIGYYIPQILKNKNNLDINKLYFSDLNFKITHNINPANKISILYFQSSDVIALTNKENGNQNSKSDFDWGNKAFGINWLSVLNQKIKIETSLSSSSYINASVSGFTLADSIQKLNIKAKTNLREIVLKSKITQYLNRNKLHFGFQISNIELGSAAGSYITNDWNSKNNIEPQKDSIVKDYKVFLNSEFEINNKFNFSVGCSTGIINKRTYDHSYFDPHISLIFKPLKRLIIDLSYSSSTKALHSLGSYSVGIPSMFWTVSDAMLPLTEIHSLNSSILFKYSKFEVKTEIYYKLLKNNILFKDIIDVYNPVSSNKVVIPMISSFDLSPENLLAGKSCLYGFNVLVNYKIRNFESFVSFSHNGVKEQFAYINFGEIYPGKYDSRYKMTFSASMKLKKTYLNLSYIIHDGQIFTLPVNIFIDTQGNEIPDFSKPNNFRMSNYQSLDLGFMWNKAIKKTELSISGGISNVLNHFNPVYSYIYKAGNVYKVSMVSGIPFNPYLSFKVSL